MQDGHALGVCLGESGIRQSSTLDVSEFGKVRAGQKTDEAEEETAREQLTIEEIPAWWRWTSLPSHLFAPGL